MLFVSADVYNIITKFCCLCIKQHYILEKKNVGGYSYKASAFVNVFAFLHLDGLVCDFAKLF